jgi:hypothetical protein
MQLSDELSFLGLEDCLIFEARKLEFENQDLKNRLRDINEKTLQIDAAVQEMEDTLHKLHLGG